MMKKNILVTGLPGCGKTTLIEKVAAGIGIPVAGFLTREIREKGKRVGFWVETFDGKKGTLAHINDQSQVRIGKYGVDLQVLEAIAVPSFHAGSSEVLVVVDEIGKMECFSLLFRKAVLSVLDSPNPVLASIAERGDPFMEGIKSRKDVEVHKILASNRDLLVVSILDEIRDILSLR
jgi:nucleoside-triphosphatase THEP1